MGGESEADNGEHCGLGRTPVAGNNRTPGLLVVDSTSAASDGFARMKATATTIQE
jgi:hypothetical protein